MVPEFNIFLMNQGVTKLADLRVDSHTTYEHHTLVDEFQDAISDVIEEELLKKVEDILKKGNLFNTKVVADYLLACQQQSKIQINEINEELQEIYKKGSTNLLEYKLYNTPVFYEFSYQYREIKLQNFKHFQKLIEKLMQKVGHELDKLCMLMLNDNVSNLHYKNTDTGKTHLLTLVIIPHITGKDFKIAMETCSSSLLTSVNFFPEHIRMFLHQPVYNNDNANGKERKKNQRVKM